MTNAVATPLDELKETLTEVFQAISNQVPSLSLTFFENKQLDTRILAFGIVEFSTKDFTHLRIQQEQNNDFSIRILSSAREKFENCSHVLFVRTEDVNQPDQWCIDQKAILRTEHDQHFANTVGCFMRDSVRARTNATIGLIYDAISPTIASGIAREVGRELCLRGKHTEHSPS